MKVVLFLDNNNGMNFFGKRQSQDIEVRKHLKSIIGDTKLYMDNYSYSLFKDVFPEAITSFNPQDDDYYLVETTLPDWSKVNEYFIYYWNRVYPASNKFDEEKIKSFKEVERIEFAGKSHDKITFVRYQKEV